MPPAGRPRRGTALLCTLGALVTACSSDGAGARPPQTSAAVTAPGTEAPGPEERVEEMLTALDRRAQIAQLFVAGVPLGELGIGDGLAESGVGGIFLAGRSDAPATELASTAERNCRPGAVRTVLTALPISRAKSASVYRPARRMTSGP